MYICSAYEFRAVICMLVWTVRYQVHKMTRLAIFLHPSIAICKYRQWSFATYGKGWGVKFRFKIFKRDNSKHELYLMDIKRKNCEQKETVKEMEVWTPDTSIFFFRKIEKSNSELREEKFIRRLEITDLCRQMDGIRRVNRELKEVNERPHGFISCIEHA